MSKDIENIIKRLSGDIVYKTYTPPREGKKVEIPEELNSRLRLYAKFKFRKGLYSHQVKSVKCSLSGKNVAINTSTASGKSVCFLLPVLNELLSDPDTRCLFIYPLKSLSNDQIKKMKEWIFNVGLGDILFKFDGDINADDKIKAIRNGRILVCTPDIVHMTLLRLNNDEYYKDFFKKLKYIILDECHVYTGVFGSHMSMVIRRLRQVCRNHGSSPQFILSSATVGNPENHIKNLTGLEDFEIITEKSNGSPVSEKTYYMIKPVEDNGLIKYVTKLTQKLVQANKRFLVFCNSRKEVENFAIAFNQSFPDNKGSIMPYRAGFEAKDRENIEKALSSNKLSGVYCTSALEMGIDLPNMDICIMAGLPGNKISMLQRAGRVGRTSPGSVIICSSNSPFDNYYFNHPDELFNKPVESLTVNLENRQILLSHFACARTESGNFKNPRLDEDIFGPYFVQIAKQINIYDYPEDILYELQPHFKVQIRCVDDPTYDIVLGWRGDDPVIGQINYSQMLREAYKGAVYLHMGKRYRVQKISYSKSQVFVDARCPMASTKPHMEVFVRPKATNAVRETKTWPGLKVWDASVSVTQKVSGYTETSGKQKNEVTYPQPMMRYYVTSGVVINLKGLKNISHGSIMGLATALENAYPIIYPCAEEDIACHAWSKDGTEAEIYLFDSTAGGMGITKSAISMFDKLVAAAYQNVTGCPSCSKNPELSDYGCIKCVLSNMWFNYTSTTRKETIALLEEIMGIIKKNTPNHIKPDDGHRKPADTNHQKNANCFGKNMIANGSLVYTSMKEEGVVIDSTPPQSSSVDDRIYKVQVGSKTKMYLGYTLTLIQGGIERWCTNCSADMISIEEKNCPCCGAILI